MLDGFLFRYFSFYSFLLSFWESCTIPNQSETDYEDENEEKLEERRKEEEKKKKKTGGHENGFFSQAVVGHRVWVLVMLKCRHLARREK